MKIELLFCLNFKPMDKTRKRDVYIDKKRYAINLKKIKSN